MIRDCELERYRCYILYGKDLRDLVLRAIIYAEKCESIYFDESLQRVAQELCGRRINVVSVSDTHRLAELIVKLGMGKLLVLAVEPPRQDVVSIAVIPVDDFNKLRAEEFIRKP